HRSALELWKHLRLSCCDAPQHEATVRGAFWPNEATWKNNRGCRKRSPAPLHCFRIVIYNGWRNFNVSSRRGTVSRPSASRSAACIFPVIYRETAQRVHGGNAGNTHFPRARRRDSMPTERKPRTAMSTQTIIVERRGRVGIVRLNRPQALNAL